LRTETVSHLQVIKSKINLQVSLSVVSFIFSVHFPGLSSPLETDYSMKNSLALSVSILDVCGSRVEFYVFVKICQAF